jgi:ribonuclease HI
MSPDEVKNIINSSSNKKEISIYTDGACSGNPGPGGWGAILVFGNIEKELSGGEKETTNNRMELTAVISALEALKQPCVVKLYSDSKYIVDAVELGWAKSWQARGWKKADNNEAKNTDLWERLLSLLKTHKVKFFWVKGHADNEYNLRCDSLAVAERKKFMHI